MIFNLGSLITFSFWKHILGSKQTWHRFLEVTGVLFLGAEILKFFDLFPKMAEGLPGFFLLMAVAAIGGATARFPVKRITYKVPQKDYELEVRIADLFDLPYDMVISTNSTFDTDTKSGLIAPSSLQGQFTQLFFNADCAELDKLIAKSLADKESERIDGPGKKRRYKLGTVAVIKKDCRTFYMLAMAHLNKAGNAQTSPAELEQSLNGLWSEIADRGELGEIAVPVIGTGRGRIQLLRQKIIEIIAQSFADASRDRKVANKLLIIVSPDDADRYGINLFQIKDYLLMSLYH